MHPFSLSAVGRCLRQPRHTPLIILPPNMQPLGACLYVCVVHGACVRVRPPVCISGLHRLSQAGQSASEDQNEAGRRFCCGSEAVDG